MTRAENAQERQLTTRFTNDVMRIVPSPKRIRGVLAGWVVFDTKRAILLREFGGVPVY
jgi:uncharacterized protein (DUF427 family)